MQKMIVTNRKIHIPGRVRLKEGALEQDFGDSPLGRFGSRAVQQAPAGAPRAAAATPPGFMSRAKNLASRALNALTTHGVRAQSKARISIEDTSAQVGELLGALSNRDVGAAEAVLAKLSTTMRPLTSRGVASDDVLEARLNVHLGNMDLQQLLALRNGLREVRVSRLESKPELLVVATRLHAEISRRVLESASEQLQRALGNTLKDLPKEADHPGATQENFNTMVTEAGTVLRQHEQSNTKRDRIALVRDVLTAKLETGELQRDQVMSILSNVSTRDLLLLLSAAPVGRAGKVEPAHDLSVLAEICLADRNNSDGLLEDTRKFIASTATRRLSALAGKSGDFAQTVVQLARQYAALREHANDEGTHLPHAVHEALASLKAKLGELLKDGKLAVDKLPDAQLFELYTALKEFDVEQGRADIAGEIDRRTNEVKQGYVDSIGNAVRLACGGDVQGMLVALEDAQAKGNEAMSRVQKMNGQAARELGDVMKKFLAPLVHEALDAFSNKDLLKAFATLNGPQAEKCLAALGEVYTSGYDVLPDGLYRHVGNSVAHVDAIRVAIEDVLKQRGVEVPDHEPKDYELKDIAKEVSGTLQQVYGIAVTPDGQFIVKRGEGPAYLQSCVEENFSAVRDQASVQLAAAGGVMSHALLKNIYMNGSLFAGIEHAMASERSPVRLPDGSPGRLVGTGHGSYEVSPNGRGGLDVHCVYTIKNCTRFLKTPGGELVQLLPERSHARFEFVVSTEADGTAKLATPVTMSYEAEPDPEQRPWNRSYPKPQNLEALLASAVPGPRQDLREFLKGEVSTENLDFLEAVEAFARNPSLTMAQTIVARFVKAGAENQVNLQAGVRDTLEQKLSAQDAAKLTPENLVALFAPAVEEIKGLMASDSFRRFIDHILDGH